MCGIFGLIAKETPQLQARDAEAIIHRLLLLSESRGKEAAGLAALGNDSIEVFKETIPASRLIRTAGYRDIIRTAGNDRRDRTFTIIGHSRLVTNGAQNTYENNQPVIAGNVVAVHNGIIVNNQALWSR